nr:hypothetical protein [Thiococcus pfennigii]
MMKISFTHWKASDGKYLGYLNDYPDHWAQGNDLNDLKDHLADLHDLFASENVPGIKRVGELEVAALRPRSQASAHQPASSGADLPRLRHTDDHRTNPPPTTGRAATNGHGHGALAM